MPVFVAPSIHTRGNGGYKYDSEVIVGSLHADKGSRDQPSPPYGFRKSFVETGVVVGLRIRESLRVDQRYVM